MKNEKLKILLVGGGSGGHIVPLLAVAKALKKEEPAIKLQIITSKTEILKSKLKNSGWDIKYIAAGKLRRHFTFRLLWELILFFAGICQSFWYILSFWPDVVFCKGGFVSVPIAKVAFIFRRPIILHESDIKMGLANKICAILAKRVCVGFPVENYPKIKKSKLVYTGTPVQQSTINHQPSTISHQPSAISTILVVGGSQGSHAINVLISQLREKITEKYRLIHICGLNDFSWLNRWSHPNYSLFSFTDDLLEKINQSDLIISRSSATVLAEIAASAKPAILIPLPTAAADHQTANARYFAQKEAAMVLAEKGLTDKKLLAEIEKIMSDKNRREKLAANILALAQPAAAELVAKIIITS